MHTIRLRGPWQATWSDAAAEGTGPRQAVYQRLFHRPTGLRAQQSVRLIVRLATDLSASTESPESLCRVTLNTRPLQLKLFDANAFQVGVEDELQPFNRLLLCRDFSSATALLPTLDSWAEVQLEIQSD